MPGGMNDNHRRALIAMLGHVDDLLAETQHAAAGARSPFGQIAPSDASSADPADSRDHRAARPAPSGTAKPQDGAAMRILVVEEEKKTVLCLHKGLVEHGFVVDVAERGDDGLHLALTAEFDLLILDVSLPGRDGWSVLAELRRAGRSTPVLFLTARDAAGDRARALALGADDYLVKPFALSDLLERVRSILCRDPASVPETLTLADLELDLVCRRASRAGIRLDLTPKEFALLELLARHRGEPFSHTAIAEEVWGVTCDSTASVVDAHIRRLRAKVDDPFQRKLIRTIRGVGYALDGDA